MNNHLQLIALALNDYEAQLARIAKAVHFYLKSVNNKVTFTRYYGNTPKTIEATVVSQPFISNNRIVVIVEFLANKDAKYPTRQELDVQRLTEHAGLKVIDYIERMQSFNP